MLIILFATLAGALMTNGYFTKNFKIVARSHIVKNVTLIVFIGLLFLLFVQPVNAWPSGFQYHTIHYIDSPSTSIALRMNMTLYNTTGTNSGQNFYLGNHVYQDDWNDLRIYRSDNATLINYVITAWGADYINITYELPSVAASDYINLYYGNSTCSPGSGSIENSGAVGYYDGFKTPYISTPFNKSSESLFAGIEPRVLHVGNEYWMYYSDHDTTSIMRRVSNDGNIWGDPVEVMTSAQLAYIYNDAGTYRMIYMQSDFSGLNLSTSSNGITFTEQGRLITKGGVGDIDSSWAGDPCEIKVGGTYYLFYSAFSSAVSGGNGVVGLATSNTGLPGSYTKQGMVLDQGEDGSIDDAAVNDPFVLEYDTSKYIMFFSGYDETKQYICYATSTDLTTWTKYAHNPLIWPTKQWEAQKIRETGPLVEDGTYKIWFSNDPGLIGYATMPQDPVTKLPANYTSINNEWTSPTGISSMIIEDDALNLYYTGYQGITTQSPIYFTDGSIEAVFKNDGNAGFSFRGVDTLQTYMVETSRNSTSGLYYFKLYKKATSYTSLASGTHQFSNNTWQKIRIDVAGNSIKVYYNDTLDITKTDATYANGSIYLGSASVYDQYFDYIAVKNSTQQDGAWSDEESYPYAYTISTGTPTVTESDTTISIIVTKNGLGNYDSSVNVSTIDGSAISGQDFIAVTNQQVTFLPDEYTKTVILSILERTDTTSYPKTFTVVLSNPTGNATLGETSELTITIEQKFYTSFISPFVSLIAAFASLMPSIVNLIIYGGMLAIVTALAGGLFTLVATIKNRL